MKKSSKISNNNPAKILAKSIRKWARANKLKVDEKSIYKAEKYCEQEVKNTDDYNLVFNEPKFSTITCSKYTENLDGSADCEFSYEEDFIDFVKSELKLKKKPTSKQIGDFILECLENSIKDEKNL